MCDIISATISGGTISAKARAPELHDAASGWHLAAFRLESRVVGGATVATIQRSPPMVFASCWIENDCSGWGTLGSRLDLAPIAYQIAHRQNFEHIERTCCSAAMKGQMSQCAHTEGGGRNPPTA